MVRTTLAQNTWKKRYQFPVIRSKVFGAVLWFSESIPANLTQKVAWKLYRTQQMSEKRSRKIQSLRPIWKIFCQLQQSRAHYYRSQERNEASCAYFYTECFANNRKSTKGCSSNVQRIVIAIRALTKFKKPNCSKACVLASARLQTAQRLHAFKEFKQSLRREE